MTNKEAIENLENILTNDLDNCEWWESINRLKKAVKVLEAFENWTCCYVSKYGDFGIIKGMCDLTNDKEKEDFETIKEYLTDD